MHFKLIEFFLMDEFKFHQKSTIYLYFHFKNSIYFET